MGGFPERGKITRLDLGIHPCGKRVRRIRAKVHEMRIGREQLPNERPTVGHHECSVGMAREVLGELTEGNPTTSGPVVGEAQVRFVPEDDV